MRACISDALAFNVAVPLNNEIISLIPGLTGNQKFIYNLAVEQKAEKLWSSEDVFTVLMKQNICGCFFGTRCLSL